MKLTNEERELFILILAAVDGIHYPYRVKRAHGGAPAALWQLRARYQQFGIPYAIGGDGDKRQSGRTLLNRLETKGLIRIHRSRGTRRQVSLSHAGYDIARGMVGLYTAHHMFDDLLDTIAPIYEQRGSNQGFIRDSWLPFEIQDLLPLLVRGWVISHCDAAGGLAYALDQLAWLEDEDQEKRLHYEIEEFEGDLPEKSDELRALYDEHLASALEAREALKPEHPSHGLYIPLSAGMWPGAEPQEAQP